MRFLIRIFRAGGNYSAMAPDLPGCVAAGKSIEKTRKLMAEAIALHLEQMQESGQKLPKPRQSVKFAIDEAADEELCTWVEVEVPEHASR
jgi:predicted RNase H-like HicB family nuclease